MANINKLVKAFEAFTNKDETTATKLFRSFFVESAQEINKNLEESDDFGEPDQGDDLVDDVAYDLDEGEDDPLAQDEPVDGGEGFGEPDAPVVDEPVGDEGLGELGDEPVDAPAAVEPPTADEWAEIEAAYAELASLFDELGVSADAPVGEPVGGDEGQGGLDFDEPADETDLNKPLGEDYDYPVPAVDTADSATNKTSPVAGNADSPVDGVEPVGIVGSATTPATPAVKVDDQNTVEKSGKGIYGTAGDKGATKDTSHSDSLLRQRK